MRTLTFKYEDTAVGFINDLTKAHKMEELVNTYLKEHPQIMTTLMKTIQPKGKFEDYDYLYSLSIEVKNDKYKSDKTDNFCFEYYNPKREEFSGIWASKADYIVYVTNTHIIFFDREELMMELLLFKDKVDRVVSGYRHIKNAGDGNASVVLYKKSFVLENFTSIKHKVSLN